MQTLPVGFPKLLVSTMAFGVGLVAAGRAGDIYGRGALFITGVAIFTASSIACGLAQDANLLNIARAFQGIGSGLLNPQAVGMIQQHFRGAERGRAFGFFGAAVGVSVAIGPVLGGLLIKVAGMEHGWRWVFFVNLPVGIAAIVLAARWFTKPLATSILVVWLRSLGMASEWWLLLTLSFIGIAQGAVISPNQTLTLADVPLTYAGSSGGIMQTGSARLWGSQSSRRWRSGCCPAAAGPGPSWPVSPPSWWWWWA